MCLDLTSSLYKANREISLKCTADGVKTPNGSKCLRNALQTPWCDVWTQFPQPLFSLPLAYHQLHGAAQFPPAMVLCTDSLFSSVRLPCFEISFFFFFFQSAPYPTPNLHTVSDLAPSQSWRLSSGVTSSRWHSVPSPCVCHALSLISCDVLNLSSHPTFVVVVQSLSHIWPFVTMWTIACQAPLSFTLSWSLLRSMSIELVMLPNYPNLLYYYNYFLYSPSLLHYGFQRAKIIFSISFSL